MNSSNIFLMAQHTRGQILQNKAVWVLLYILGALILFAGITGFYQYKNSEAIRIRYQQAVRHSWEASPDKNPHRMAHYGFIAFRPKSALSIFDYGVENYTGNAVFLEAHRQNSTNFSEASLSTSLLRFGEISIAMVLQILIPLFIFFTGFNAIAQDRENGTLKILMSQGLSSRDLLSGKILGIASVASYVLIPAFIYAILLNIFANSTGSNALHLMVTFAMYALSLFIYSSIAVCVSAWNKTSKLSLVLLIGIWLLLIIVMPRATRMMANSVYAPPSKIAFENAIEQDILKEGDSHNPEDKQFKALKDSVLKANKAATIQQLNFNYSGFQMAEGEKISTQIYNIHLAQLLGIYKKQNDLLAYAAFLNPYLGIKQLSMAFSQTDFYTYTSFQKQAEGYRYDLSQQMNALQIKYIPNQKQADTAKDYTINKNFWGAFKDFTYSRPSFASIVQNEALAIGSLLFEAILIMVIVIITSQKLKVI